jgi:hypothetical protein
MIAPAVGYRVEGVAEGPSSVIKSPTEADGLLNGVFNLEMDNDMRYYQDNFMAKRMHHIPAQLRDPFTLHHPFLTINSQTITMIRHLIHLLSAFIP